MTSFELRPFNTSRSYANLKRHGFGVFHVTDDVEMLAKAALGKLEPLPQLAPSESCEGFLITDACRWYSFRVQDLNDSEERVSIQCETIDRGRFRDFFGFNRAKHAVLEAAILATRLHILDEAYVRDAMDRLQSPVEKTAGPQETRAFALVREHCDTHWKNT